MAIITNKNTQQAPIIAPSGANWTQSIRYIPAPRVYVKTVDPALDLSSVGTTASPLSTKSSGSTPSGWTDLGIVEGQFKLTYDKKVKEIRTGIDQYLRLAYVNQKNAQFEFSLGQMDEYVLGQVSGLTASVLSTGSVVQYQLGQEDMVTVQLLLVHQNKIDGREWQFYNPQAFINFQFEDAQDALQLKCTGFIPLFKATGASVEGLLSTTIFK